MLVSTLRLDAHATPCRIQIEFKRELNQQSWYGQLNRLVARFLHGHRRFPVSNTWQNQATK